MTTREQFLDRVRKALGRSAGVSHGEPSSPASAPLGRVLPPVAAENLIGTFQEELKKVGGVSHHAGTSDELDQVLREILGPTEAGPIILSRNPLLGRLGIAERMHSLGHPVTSWPAGEATREQLAQFRNECFSAQAGITGADLALVESGSFVLTSFTEGSQLASLAPPLHIVLYLRGQVVETLEEALGRYAAGPNSPATAGRSIVFITGQSRTADIEQISIRGVHGPLAIHAVLIEEACLTPASSPG